ncbi:unnamed protein product [Allacma fusca]|uniref:Uncharacterized protein n=1 Tax=Allacma fusca TaxID=39272 RepID=A0A8J2KDQ1_9HEXA|nr:unnamed protein product [Allacma fusca]
MKLLVAFAIVAFVGYVSAAPKPQEVTIVQNESVINEDGSFRTVLELSDGTSISQSGKIKNPTEPDPEKKIQVIEGSYKFTDAKTGEVVNVKYVADENGYQPVLSRK